MMNYRIEEKPEMILTGYKAHFTGAPYGKDRERQEEQLFITTRGKQWFLQGAAGDTRDTYCLITSLDDEGYDFYCCAMLGQWNREHLYDREVTGVDFVEELGLEHITLPRTTYAIFETQVTPRPIEGYFELLNSRIQILTEWMPEMGFQLARAPELAVYHWRPRNERKIQLWMPVEKIQ